MTVPTWVFKRLRSGQSVLVLIMASTINRIRVEAVRVSCIGYQREVDAPGTSTFLFSGVYCTYDILFSAPVLRRFISKRKRNEWIAWLESCAKFNRKVFNCLLSNIPIKETQPIQSACPYFQFVAEKRTKRLSLELWWYVSWRLTTITFLSSSVWTAVGRLVKTDSRSPWLLCSKLELDAFIFIVFLPVFRFTLCSLTCLCCFAHVVVVVVVVANCD